MLVNGCVDTILYTGTTHLCCGSSKFVDENEKKKKVLHFSLNMEKDIIESSFTVDHLLYVFCMYLVCPSFQESYIAWAEGPRMCDPP